MFTALTGGDAVSGTARPRTDLTHHSGAGVFALRRDEDDAPLEDDLRMQRRRARRRPAPGSTGQLYDLSRDLDETANLWHRHPDVVHTLGARLAARRCFSKRPPR